MSPLRILPLSLSALTRLRSPKEKKPLDVPAKGLSIQLSRGDSVFTEQRIEFTAEDLCAA
jgi:hypothetical protein